MESERGLEEDVLKEGAIITSLYTILHMGMGGYGGGGRGQFSVGSEYPSTAALQASFLYRTDRYNSTYLKTLDTFGNCQRRVFSLGVSQHVHKITDRWKFELNLSSKF